MLFLLVLISLAWVDPVNSSEKAPPICTGLACAHYFKGLHGSKVSDLTSSPNYPNSPSETITLSSGKFETKKGYGEQYGVLLVGWIRAPKSGKYVFLTNSDDSSEVWIGTSPENKHLTKVVELAGCCRTVIGTRQVSLKKGEYYYVKAMMKEAHGGDYLRVGIRRLDTAGNSAETLMPIPLWMFGDPCLNKAKPSFGAHRGLQHLFGKHQEKCCSRTSDGHSCLTCQPGHYMIPDRCDGISKKSEFGCERKVGFCLSPNSVCKDVCFSRNTNIADSEDDDVLCSRVCNVKATIMGHKESDGTYSKHSSIPRKWNGYSDVTCVLHKIVDCKEASVEHDPNAKSYCEVQKRAKCLHITPAGHEGEISESMREACTDEACSTIARCR